MPRLLRQHGVLLLRPEEVLKPISGRRVEREVPQQTLGHLRQFGVRRRVEAVGHLLPLGAFCGRREAQLFAHRGQAL